MLDGCTGVFVLAWQVAGQEDFMKEGAAMAVEAVLSQGAGERHVTCTARSAPRAWGIFRVSIVVPFESRMWGSLESLQYGALLLQHLRLKYQPGRAVAS